MQDWDLPEDKDQRELVIKLRTIAETYLDPNCEEMRYRAMSIIWEYTLRKDLEREEREK